MRLAPSLTSQERAFVHAEADSLGLGHSSVGHETAHQLVLTLDPRDRPLTEAEEEAAAVVARRAA